MSHMQMPRQYGERGRRRRTGPPPEARRRSAGGATRLSGAGTPRLGLAYAIGAGLLAVIVAGRAGAHLRLWEFLDFGAGVLALVSLTGAVLWGLAATDRLVLHSPHRLLAQGVHRGLAVSGICFLLLHIWVKVTEQRTSIASAALPFTDVSRPLLIGLGSLAGYLFIAVAVVGAVRSAFTSQRRSRWWRALHMGAYPAWGAALIHGLRAGRPAAGWVEASYLLAAVGVMAALALRLRLRNLATGPRTPGERGPEDDGRPGRASRQLPETVVQLPIGGAQRSDRRGARARSRGWAS